MAVLSKSGKVVLLQMDGDLSVEEFDQATEMILTATKRINEIQREALSTRFVAEIEEGGE